MARRLTVGNLVEDVRSLIDESNQVSIETERDIIPALNRASDICCNLLAGHYESPLLAWAIVPTVSGLHEYPIPRDAFENRLEKIEIQIQPNLYNPVKRINYRDATFVETTTQTAFPMYYSEIGDNFRLYPTSTGAYNMRVWYIKEPGNLVLEQGTVTAIAQNTASIVVDTVGSSLTTENDSYGSYVNFIDGTTGRLKGTCQIRTLSNNRISFKTTPTRTLILDTPVQGFLPTDLSPDDLICTVEGTCISALKRPFANALIQIAVSELLNTKLGMQSELAEKMRKEMEDIVKKSWEGRESYMRVRAANPHFERIGRRAGNRY